MWKHDHIWYSVVAPAVFRSSYLALSCAMLLSCFVDKTSEVWPDCVLARSHGWDAVATVFTLDSGLGSSSQILLWISWGLVPGHPNSLVYHNFLFVSMQRCDMRKKTLEPIANSYNLGCKKSGDTSRWKELYTLKQLTWLCLGSEGRRATG